VDLLWLDDGVQRAMHLYHNMGSLGKRVVKLQLDICHHLMELLVGLVDDRLVELVAIVELELVAIVERVLVENSIGSIVVVGKLVAVVPSDLLVLDCEVQRYHRLGNLGIYVDQLQLDIVQLFVVLRQVQR
jgi:hypothetical protein